MSDGAEIDARFSALWPTVFMRDRLPGHELANQELETVIEALDSEKPDLTTDYLDENFLLHDNPAVAWLRDCVQRCIGQYFQHLGMDYGVEWVLQSWPNINRFGDYHDAHNHPHAYLSGTYYVAVPADRAPLESRADVRPGCISFYDPRGAVNMGAIRGDPQIEAEHTIDPQPGEILLWPAFINHFVHPNLSQSPRISISFNAVLKWKDDYLPEQP